MPPEWKEIEDAADTICMFDLGGRYPLVPRVKELDNRILVDERAALMSDSGNDWDAIGHLAPLGVQIEGWPPEKAKKEWLDRYYALRLILGGRS